MFVLNLVVDARKLFQVVFQVLLNFVLEVVWDVLDLHVIVNLRKDVIFLLLLFIEVAHYLRYLAKGIGKLYARYQNCKDAEKLFDVRFWHDVPIPDRSHCHDHEVESRQVLARRLLLVSLVVI